MGAVGADCVKTRMLTCPGPRQCLPTRRPLDGGQDAEAWVLASLGAGSPRRGQRGAYHFISESGSLLLGGKGRRRKQEGKFHFKLFGQSTNVLPSSFPLPSVSSFLLFSFVFVSFFFFP